MAVPTSDASDRTHLRLVADVALRGRELSPTGEEYAKVDEAHRYVSRLLEERRVVYGITTGFGPLADTYVDPGAAEELQRHLLSHLRAGVGSPLRPEHVRAMMAGRVLSLMRGRSGVRREVVDLLINMLRKNVVPVVPSMGTVGASGDLTPLAHMAATLAGEGEVWIEGERVPAAQAFARAGLTPLVFQAKEGIALVNGTSAMAGIAAVNADEFRRQIDLGIRASLMYAEIFSGRAEAFDPRLGRLRPHAGQIEVHRRLAELTAVGSRLVATSSTLDSLPSGEPSEHADSAHPDAGPRPPARAERPVQDPYTIRCVPQLYGAALDVLAFHDGIVETELASVTDNPVLFPEDDVVVQGGNFFGQHVAFASDALSNAVITIAGHMERAIARLTDPVRSQGLPPMLQPRSPGRQSGFMGAQVTATALLAEMRTHAIPASIQSIPTNADNQDVVTMGTIAARNTAAQIEMLWDMTAIFLLVLAQAAQLRTEEETPRDPAESSGAAGAADGGAHGSRSGAAPRSLQGSVFARSSIELHELVRKHSARLDDDRPLSGDIERLSAALSVPS